MSDCLLALLLVSYTSPLCSIQQQQEVLAWLLEPLSKQWTPVEWQNAYLSEPLGLVRLCSETHFMWLLYHTVTFFEKALKRSGTKKGNSNLQNCLSESQNSTPLHPITSHLSWMLPPLLRVCLMIHEKRLHCWTTIRQRKIIGILAQ